MPSNTKADNQTLSMPRHMPVCIRFFDEALEEELHRGIITHSCGERFTVQAIEVIPIPEQPGAEVYYQDENHKFVRVQASLAESHIEDQRSTLEMVLTADQGKYAEQRGSFRVSVAGQGMTVTVDGKRGFRALDVSAEGMGVISPQPLEVGQAVQVHIEFDGQHIGGSMTVRTVRKRRDKKFRCGLQSPSPSHSPELVKTLQTIAMSVQRELLCRLSAIDSASKKLGGHTPTITDRTSPISKSRRASRPATKSMPGKPSASAKPLAGSGAGETPRASDKAPQAHNAQLLLRLPVDELIGKRLPGELLDSSGRVVVSKGDVLNAATVAALTQTPLYASGDWLKAVAYEYEEQDRLQTGDERRKNIRRAWQTKMQVDLRLQGFARCIDATTIDLSRGGYSFMANCNVPNGTTIKANVTIGGTTHQIRGVVRNCIQLKASGHRVSVQFTDEMTRKPGHNGYGSPAKTAAWESTRTPEVQRVIG